MAHTGAVLALHLRETGEGKEAPMDATENRTPKAGVIDIRRTATESLALLKAATNFSATKPQIPLAPVATLLPSNDVTAAPAGPGPSVISVNVQFTGSIASPDDVHIHGSVTGDIRAIAITIFEDATVKGDIIAETVIVRGSVEGRIYGRTVQFMAGAVVRGDIIHGALGMDTAAQFEGAAKRSADPLADLSAAA